MPMYIDNSEYWILAKLMRTKDNVSIICWISNLFCEKDNIVVHNGIEYKVIQGYRMRLDEPMTKDILRRYYPGVDNAYTRKWTFNPWERVTNERPIEDANLSI